MDTGKLLLLGGVGVGGYFAYQWYYGSGGQADETLCGSMTAADLQALAAKIQASAAAAGVSAASALATYAANPGTLTAQNLACMRVAIKQYPTAAASSSAGTTTTTGTTTSTQSPAPLSPQPQQPPPVTGVVPPASASDTALDQIYANLKAAASQDAFFTGSGDSLTSSVDHWNVYLVQGTGLSIPGGMFAGVSGDDSNHLTAAQYWAVMAPWVAAQKGLSGLGVFGGLGALVRGYR